MFAFSIQQVTGFAGQNIVWIVRLESWRWQNNHQSCQICLLLFRLTTSCRIDKRYMYTDLELTGGGWGGWTPLAEVGNPASSIEKMHLGGVRFLGYRTPQSCRCSRPQTKFRLNFDSSNPVYPGHIFVLSALPNPLLLSSPSVVYFYTLGDWTLRQIINSQRGIVNGN